MNNDLYVRLQSFSVCIDTQEYVDVKKDICKQAPCFAPFALKVWKPDAWIPVTPLL